MTLPPADPEQLTKNADPQALERLLTRLVDDSVDPTERLKQLSRDYMLRAIEKFPTGDPERYFGELFMTMYMVWYMKNYAEEGFEMLSLAGQIPQGFDVWVAAVLETLTEKFPEYQG